MLHTPTFMPGDLALVVGCRSVPSLNGCCVEVVEYCGAWEFPGVPMQDFYLIRHGIYRGHARVGVLMPLQGDTPTAKQNGRSVTDKEEA